MGEKKLTPKQEKFCQEYIVDLNACQAAIRAGYSEKTARSIGQENLTKPDIIDRIAAFQESRSKKTKLTAEFIVNGLMQEAQYCGEGASHGARVRAFEILGKHRDINLWKENVDHTLKEGMSDKLMRARERTRNKQK